MRQSVDDERRARHLGEGGLLPEDDFFSDAFVQTCDAPVSVLLPASP